MPVHAYSSIENDINDLAHAEFNNITQKRALINRAVRDVLMDADLRSSKRRTQLSPALFQGIYDYTKPSDLKAWKVIDVIQQVNRPTAHNGRFVLTTPNEFDQMKREYRNLLAVDDRDFVGKLRISALPDDDKTVLHDFESLTSDGTVQALGAANNLTVDSGNYVSGSRSVNFDIDTTGVAPGVEVVDFTAVDLSEYEDDQLFAWVYLQDASKVSSIDLRWGSASNAYYQRNVTTTNEGLDLQDGWNLLRFDWDSSVTTSGSPDIENIDYLAIILNLGSALATEVTDWRIDAVIARRGVIHDVLYYSKYLWQTSAGVYIENSTADTDLLNVDTEELNIILKRIDYLVARSLKNKDDIVLTKGEYEKAVEYYHMMVYPSEALLPVTTTHRFQSAEGDLASNDVINRDS